MDENLHTSIDSDSHSTNDENTSDMSYDDQHYYSDVSEPEHLSKNQLPLVPTDFSSVDEALQNFSTVFESRYGKVGPRFQTVSLRSALDNAFNKDKQSIAEQKPFALYLHRDDGIACNIFAENILCSEAISSLLNEQFIVWPWDMTNAENRSKFFKWLDENHLLQIMVVAKAVPKDQYPFMFLLTKCRGTVDIQGIVRGTDTVEKVMDKLVGCMATFEEIKNLIAIEEHERLERAAVMQEQAEAYEKSKAMDRAKQEEAQRKRQQEIEEQEEQVKQMEAKQRRQSELAATIPDEPLEQDTETIAIRLRLPTNEQKIRRFRLSEQFIWLATYVESLGFDMETHSLWTSDLPRKLVSPEDMVKTFAQIGWPRREQIIVNEK